MERKTHILFTITSMYWLATLFKQLELDYAFFIWYIGLVSSFPLISIPFQAITTSLPDTDWYKNRFTKTIFYPATKILQFFTKHRWFTHRIEWIICFSALMLWFFVLGTNIITLSLIWFFWITIIWVLIDDFRLKILWFRIRKIWFWKLSYNIDEKLIDKIFSTIILLYIPVLTDESTYYFFLISLIFAYVWHMFGDYPSKEGWTLFEIPWTKYKLKVPYPKILTFRVWWKFEKKLRFFLWILLVYILWIDREFWFQKIIHDSILSYKQVIFIINNPEILISDMENIKERWIWVYDLLKEIRNFINHILGKILG